MSLKICRNALALAAVAALLSIAPARAEGPKLRQAQPESPWQTVASLWSATAREVVSWWKDSPKPSQQNRSCQNGAVSCSSNPKPPGEVGSAIDPDGKP